MRSFLIFLVLLLSVGLAMFARHRYICKIHPDTTQMCSCKDCPTESDRLMNLQFTKGDSVILSGYEQFQFDTSDLSRPLLSDNNQKFLEEVANYLKANPTERITITGKMLESESNIQLGIFEKLGVARANSIKSKLAELGVSGDRIDLNYQVVSDEAAMKSPFSISVNVTRNTATANTGNDDDIPEDYENTGGGEAFSFTNMSFSDANFALNSADFNPGLAFKNYADSVKIYLTENQEKTLLLTGHTCDRGNDNYNLELGKKRAKSVKQYFLDLGVKASINTDSKGESAPAYPNSDEANRSKNRRVNIQIQ